MKKKLLISLLAIVMCFTLAGCNNEKTNDDKSGNNNKQEEKNNEDTLGVGKYKIEKKNNSVLVITNDSAAITTTEYKFNGDTLDNIVVTQKFSTNDLAEMSYNMMKNEAQITEQYTDIKLKGNTITYTFKEELKTIYTEFTKDALYDLMIETYKAYMEE